MNQNELVSTSPRARDERDILKHHELPTCITFFSHTRRLLNTPCMNPSSSEQGMVRFEVWRSVKVIAQSSHSIPMATTKCSAPPTSHNHLEFQISVGAMSPLIRFNCKGHTSCLTSSLVLTLCVCYNLHNHCICGLLHETL